MEQVRRQFLDGLRAYTTDIHADDPVAWVAENLPALHLRAYQERILRKVAGGRRLAGRSLHGTGKTTVEAVAVLWFADVAEKMQVDWKVITTASAWRHLSVYLWPEIHKWAAGLPSGHWIHRGLKMRQINGRYGQATAVASNRPEKIEGAHASRLLYLFSEAKAIPSETWDAAEGAFSTGDCRALALSTPGRPAGRFYDYFSKRDAYQHWDLERISLEEALAEHAVSPEWVENCRRSWGEDSPIYKSRVLGEFASDGGQTIIPLAWIEQAVERFKLWKAAGHPGILRALGVDVATEAGIDKSVICGHHGPALCFRAYQGIGVLALADRVNDYCDESGADAGIPVTVDANGVGVGTAEELAKRRRVIPFKGGAATDRKDSTGLLGFFDCNSAAMWGLREQLDPERKPTLAIEPLDEVIEELSARTYWETSRGLIRAEDKDSLKLELGHSPDYSDAAMMCEWGLGERPVVRAGLLHAAGVRSRNLPDWGNRL